MIPVNPETINRIQQSPNDFRILERIPYTSDSFTFPCRLHPIQGDEIRVIVLDLETTSLDTSTAKVIEIGMVELLYSPSMGAVTEIVGKYSELECPGEPLSDEVQRATGITDEMVAGKRIDDAGVAQFIGNDPLVIGHNAVSYDRPIFERRFPSHKGLRWACSLKDVPWRSLGFESAKLDYLAMRLGGFYDAHRASTDCLALIWVLDNVGIAWRVLMDNGLQSSYIVRAIGAPFEVKDVLKANGYRWDDGESGRPKHWWKSVAHEHLEQEKVWLFSLAPRARQSARVDEVTARTRYT